jgi:hypothetical protein
MAILLSPVHCSKVSKRFKISDLILEIYGCTLSSQPNCLGCYIEGSVCDSIDDFPGNKANLLVSHEYHRQCLLVSVVSAIFATIVPDYHC